MKNCSKDLLRGFTLIELLVVVLIIGILAAVAVPKYQASVDRAKYLEAMTLTTKLAQAEEVYFMSNGKYTDDFAELDISFPYTLSENEEGKKIWWSQNRDYYLSSDSNINGGKYVYGKYNDAKVLYLVYLNTSPNAGKKQCRTHAPDAKRGEKVCLGLGGVYAGEGPFNGKIYNLPW